MKISKKFFLFFLLFFVFNNVFKKIPLIAEDEPVFAEAEDDETMMVGLPEEAEAPRETVSVQGVEESLAGISMQDQEDQSIEHKLASEEKRASGVETVGKAKKEEENSKFDKDESDEKAETSASQESKIREIVPSQPSFTTESNVSSSEQTTIAEPSKAEKSEDSSEKKWTGSQVKMGGKFRINEDEELAPLGWNKGLEKLRLGCEELNFKIEQIISHISMIVSKKNEEFRTFVDIPLSSLMQKVSVWVGMFSSISKEEKVYENLKVSAATCYSKLKEVDDKETELFEILKKLQKKLDEMIEKSIEVRKSRKQLLKIVNKAELENALKNLKEVFKKTNEIKLNIEQNLVFDFDKKVSIAKEEMKAVKTLLDDLESKAKEQGNYLKEVEKKIKEKKDAKEKKIQKGRWNKFVESNVKNAKYYFNRFINYIIFAYKKVVSDIEKATIVIEKEKVSKKKETTIALKEQPEKKVMENPEEMGPVSQEDIKGNIPIIEQQKAN